ncbi:putative glucuronosyltransferase [Iris pallida]|uniref:Glucuronosyltransferase n=1 Tax=Iris pallida TaxID=29817 RepID=A0AAX6I8C2_IRIPA|nr:putative glucuronosyltransferase [Iris pallida]KAJ6849014.1 putative glucuronosyltransferase [Iris pallida]
MKHVEVRLGKNGGGLPRRAAAFARLDDDPGEVVGYEHERVHHPGQVEGLEGPHVRRGDDDNFPRAPDDALPLLLPLHELEDAVGPLGLGRVRVGPGADADAVAAYDDMAGRMVGAGSGSAIGG